MKFEWNSNVKIIIVIICKNNNYFISQDYYNDVQLSKIFDWST